RSIVRGRLRAPPRCAAPELGRAPGADAAAALLEQVDRSATADARRGPYRRLPQRAGPRRQGRLGRRGREAVPRSSPRGYVREFRQAPGCLPGRAGPGLDALGAERQTASLAVLTGQLLRRLARQLRRHVCLARASRRPRLWLALFSA